MSRTVGKLLQCDRCSASVFLPWTNQGVEWSRDADDSNFQEPPKDWGKGELHIDGLAPVSKDLCPACYVDFIKSHNKFWGIVMTEEAER